MSIFPTGFYYGKQANATTENYYLKDYLIDMATGEIVLNETGQAIEVEGIEALNCRIWRKLHTRKGLYLIYDEDYGNTLDEVFGKSKSYIDKVIFIKLSEAIVDNYYVTGIKNIETKLENGIYVVNFQIDTVFGIIEEGLTITMD